MSRHRPNKISREILSKIKPYAEKYGATCSLDAETPNHPCLIIEYNNKKIKSYFPCTPSNKHYIQYKLNDVEKILKELGAI